MLRTCDDLKEGMMVAIVKEKGDTEDLITNWNEEGHMDHLLGKVVPVKSVRRWSFGPSKITVHCGDEEVLREHWFLTDAMIDWERTNEVNGKEEGHKHIVVEWSNIGYVDLYINEAKGTIVAKKGRNRAKAKLHPDDKWDEMLGRQLACMRLEKKMLENAIQSLLSDVEPRPIDWNEIERLYQNKANKGCC